MQSLFVEQEYIQINGSITVYGGWEHLLDMRHLLVRCDNTILTAKGVLIREEV